MTGIRVHAPRSPGLTGFLNAVTPGELSHFALVALGKGRRALPALPAFMPNRRDGWVLDARDAGVSLWSRATGRVVKVDPGFFVACVELYARLALDPWEGMDIARPGEPREGRAPRWVDGLRIAHIELLRALRGVGLSAMEWEGEGLGPLPEGRYASNGVSAELGARGVRTGGPMDVLFEGRVPLELPAIARALLFEESMDLPALPAALGGRSKLSVQASAHEVRLVGEETIPVPREALMALVELELRWTLARFEGRPVARPKRPDTGCPPWVGKGRYWGAMLAGRLLGDRLALAGS